MSPARMYSTAARTAAAVGVAVGRQAERRAGRRRRPGRGAAQPLGQQPVAVLDGPLAAGRGQRLEPPAAVGALAQHVVVGGQRPVGQRRRGAGRRGQPLDPAVQLVAEVADPRPADPHPRLALDVACDRWCGRGPGLGCRREGGEEVVAGAGHPHGLRPEHRASPPGADEGEGPVVVAQRPQHLRGGPAARQRAAARPRGGDRRDPGHRHHLPPPCGNLTPNGIAPHRRGATIGSGQRPVGECQAT